jgi:hypothetical protein
MRYWNRTSRIQDGIEIPGMYTHAFIHNGSYFVSEIRVYQDGIIDCWDLVDFEGFKQKIVQGWVVTTLPNNAPVSVSRLVRFTATETQTFVKEEEFIKEVADAIEELNRRPTSTHKCRAAFQRFQEEHSEEARQQVQKTYEAVPEHLRWFLLDEMDPDIIDVQSAWNVLNKKES